MPNYDKTGPKGQWASTGLGKWTCENGQNRSWWYWKERGSNGCKNWRRGINGCGNWGRRNGRWKWINNPFLLEK